MDNELFTPVIDMAAAAANPINVGEQISLHQEKIKNLQDQISSYEMKKHMFIAFEKMHVFDDVLRFKNLQCESRRIILNKCNETYFVYFYSNIISVDCQYYKKC